eukprot:CAMPEP_0174866976 /NCGR_PEP_ID=MMETSP1114-20130205/63110_1 /TAXON_ID=312471 /ORGANISM="Neobodo designis, Strain CCAP 1951/1" /LENGTH=49 /DNA_ID= /DNA_START= /DNA_END= /DNA_ORIENTATION=
MAGRQSTGVAPEPQLEGIITEDVDPETLYDLSHKLGEGGSGCTVYRAVH